MYLRFTRRWNADGSMVCYVALAYNHRLGGTTKPRVPMNLGRIEAVDVDGLWHELGIAAAIEKAVADRRFTTAVERVLFALVANRALAPMSNLSAAEWAGEDVVVQGLVSMDEDHAYRAMDLLVEADVAGAVPEAVFFSVAHLLNLEVDLLFFDTTSTYFETDTPDADQPAEDGDGGGEPTPGFRKFGKSKDHRDDLPQVVIGLAITREGIPVRVWCWLGNTNDQSVLEQVKDDLRIWKLGRVITVVDRGFSSSVSCCACPRMESCRGHGHLSVRDRAEASARAGRVAPDPSSSVDNLRPSTWIGPTRRIGRGSRSSKRSGSAGGQPTTSTGGRRK